MLEKLRKERGDEGFTLIELLVVIIIIGILAAIAIPVFLNQRQKGWEAAVKSDLRNAATAQETYLTESNTYLAGDVVGLASMGFKYSDTKNYAGGSAVIMASTSGNQSYCLNATAASGNAFSYSSPGGLKSGTCTIP
jgi:type IV pilus assembly protein PilA